MNFNRLVITFCLLLLFSCQQKDDKIVIAEKIEAMVVAVEAEQRRDLLKFFSEQVVVQKQLARRDVGALAFRYFYAYDNIKLYVNFITIDLDGQKLLANVTAKVLLTSGKELVPERASLYEVSGNGKK